MLLMHSLYGPTFSGYPEGASTPGWTLREGQPRPNLEGPEAWGSKYCIWTPPSFSERVHPARFWHNGAGRIAGGVHSINPLGPPDFEPGESSN